MNVLRTFAGIAIAILHCTSAYSYIGPHSADELLAKLCEAYRTGAPQLALPLFQAGTVQPGVKPEELLQQHLTIANARGGVIACDTLSMEETKGFGLGRLRIAYRDGFRSEEILHFKETEGHWFITMDPSESLFPDGELWKSVNEILDQAERKAPPTQREQERLTQWSIALICDVMAGEDNRAVQKLSNLEALTSTGGWHLDQECQTVYRERWRPLLCLSTSEGVTRYPAFDSIQQEWRIEPLGDGLQSVARALGRQPKEIGVFSVTLPYRWAPDSDNDAQAIRAASMRKLTDPWGLCMAWVRTPSGFKLLYVSEAAKPTGSREYLRGN